MITVLYQTQAYILSITPQKFEIQYSVKFRLLLSNGVAGDSHPRGKEAGA
jgi:hypothetical protein